MTKLYAWLETQADGQEGIVAVVIPGLAELGATPLVSTRPHLADQMRFAAEGHARSTGRPVRLAVFKEVTE